MSRSSRPITVTLGELHDHVEARVKSGAYASASEVLRAAVRALDREEVAIGDWLRQRVDEAFADFDGHDESVAPSLPSSGVVVLRSFGKTYGLAGLRLGFALASPEIVTPLRAALGPWPVSGPAIAIGIRALADSDWLEAMGARLGGDAVRLNALLHGAGWRIIGGTRLFRLAAHTDARIAFERLLVAGILTRPFAEAPDRLRFGIPADENAWERLAAGLRG